MMTMYKWYDPALKQIWQKLYADNSYLFGGVCCSCEFILTNLTLENLSSSLNNLQRKATLI